MSHNRNNRPRGLRANTTPLGRIEEKLDLIIENQNKLGSLIAGSQLFAQAVATSQYRRDLRTMADFTGLNAKVAKLTDISQSFKTMNDGLKAERDAAKAEVEALKAADSADQSAVDAAEAELAKVETTLAALAAVADNTGISTGGI